MCSSINNTWIKWSSGNRKKQNKTTTTKTNKQKKSTQSNTYVHMQNIYVLWMPLVFSYIRRPSPCVKLDHSVWRHTTQAIKKDQQFTFKPTDVSHFTLIIRRIYIFKYIFQAAWPMLCWCAMKTRQTKQIPAVNIFS